MGYLDLNAAYAHALPLDAFTGPAQARGEARAFTGLEWTTILLARRDGLASLAPPRPIARLFGRLIGIAVKSRLADGRLETLRRFAVLAWAHGYNVPQSEYRAVAAAGYTMAQAETLLASVAVARAER